MLKHTVGSVLLIVFICCIAIFISLHFLEIFLFLIQAGIGALFTFLIMKNYIVHPFSPEDVSDNKNKKFCYIGAPKVFSLEMATKQINHAFGDYGCYIVGSSLERMDWRDVDIRFIMPDEQFYELFSKVDSNSLGAVWEFDEKWLLLTTSISQWLKQQTGLPIDFQIQPITFANKFHNKNRIPVGIDYKNHGDK